MPGEHGPSRLVVQCSERTQSGAVVVWWSAVLMLRTTSYMACTRMVRSKPGVHLVATASCQLPTAADAFITDRHVGQLHIFCSTPWHAMGGITSGIPYSAVVRAD